MKVVIGLAALAIAATAFAASLEITQKDKLFSVSEIQASVGDELTFVNSDTVVHNVASVTDGYEFDLGFQKPGQRISTRLTKSGKIDVRCAIHPKMKLTVTVK
jgi:plastocyanin